MRTRFALPSVALATRRFSLSTFLQTPCALLVCCFCLSGELARAATISGTVDYEALFANLFAPGGAPGIGITAADVQTGATSGTGFTDVNLDGLAGDDIRVTMSYQIFRGAGGTTTDSQTGGANAGVVDSLIRFTNSGSAITMATDSSTGNDYDYGFMSSKWTVTSLQPGYVLTGMPNITASSTNGSTEEYEFGIVDTNSTPVITGAMIAGYDASLYTGTTPNDFSGAANSYGDASEILLPEYIGGLTGQTYSEATTVNGVTFDAGATIIGDLATASAAGDQSDLAGGVAVPGNTVTLWYGGFDLGRGTSIGSPSASFNFSGTTTLTFDENGGLPAVPEPSTLLFAIVGTMSLGVLTWRRQRS